VGRRVEVAVGDGVAVAVAVGVAVGGRMVAVAVGVSSGNSVAVARAGAVGPPAGGEGDRRLSLSSQSAVAARAMTSRSMSAGNTQETQAPSP